MRKFYVCVGVLALLLLVGCVRKQTFVSSYYPDTSPANAAIFIQRATAAPQFQGKVSLDEVTGGVSLAFQQMGAKVVGTKEESDYTVNTKVINLTDIFDNIVHVTIEIDPSFGGKAVYLGKYAGEAFTQSSSISTISRGIVLARAEIFGSINKHYNEEAPTKMAAAPAVEMPLPSTPAAVARPIALNVAMDKRYALVIGNGRYSASPLKNPGRDAQDVSFALRRLGFTVLQKNDASLREMEQAMDMLHDNLKGGGVGLFYYAGHGIQVDGKNYLIPTDAKISSESDVKYECVDAGRILGKMEDAGNGMNIVILDACRNNPFARSFRSASRGLVRMDAPTGSILAYSTAPGSVAADGTGRNGIYTKHLLQYMLTPGLDLNSVFIRTRMDVIKETGGKQVPWESSSLTGLFYFAGQEAKEVQ
ncbi:caspase family protein [uncultured Trichococcus sp.]|uniref:caspase family protein n=1 Tax=uncultured Trichococcus sp. TaxID=189665 RepID=UPI0029C8658B|nr:caspase family protein [uncultured Trichococcus sp.]